MIYCAAFSTAENSGKSMRFGGPVLTAATTVFDMVTAESSKDRCIAPVTLTSAAE